MREAAMMAALMPGFGNPLDVPIDDFTAAMEHWELVAGLRR